MWQGEIQKAGEAVWRIPKSYKPGMRTDGLLFADERALPEILSDQAPEQVANVATLPGIVGAAMAMPDIHWGYGFPIGGVAATDVRTGVVSPGGVGYDINCGVRLLRSQLSEEEIKPKARQLAEALFHAVPSGVGRGGRIRRKPHKLDEVLAKGMAWAIGEGYGWEEDVCFAEEEGRLSLADPDKVSQRAKERGADQLGTLGSGNHFLEVQAVDKIFDEPAAARLGLWPGQAVVMIHTGSRGLGYQTCDDYLRLMEKATARYGIELPDRQLACVPVASPEGRDYLGAMSAAANFAFANRQCVTHLVREAFGEVFRRDPHELGLTLLYDVAHNIAKIETHVVEGKKRKLCVHRKGATRAFAPLQPGLPDAYRETGQPVIIPGDMGTYSYVLVGTEEAMRKSFGSTCHGAGRRLSRTKAKKMIDGRELLHQLENRGILVRAHSVKLLSEEAPDAYKDVGDVVAICEAAGLSRRVARLRPLICIKG